MWQATKTRYKLYHYFQKFVGVRRFWGFWSTFCGLRFKTVRCIVQRSSWSESSPISNMRIFLGQTTVQKGTILSFAISHLLFPLCLNLLAFTVSRLFLDIPQRSFVSRGRENVHAYSISFWHHQRMYVLCLFTAWSLLTLAIYRSCETNFVLAVAVKVLLSSFAETAMSATLWSWPIHAEPNHLTNHPIPY